MTLKVLTVLSVFLVSMITNAAATNSEVAFDTLLDLQRGVRNGYVNDLSPEKQKQFISLLNDASDLLYGYSNPANYSCVNQGSGWYAVVDIETNTKLGENVGTLSDCQKVLPPKGRLYACVNQGSGWYAVYNMLKAQKLGENVGTFSDCTKVLPPENAKFACINQGSGWYAVFNLKTNTKLGQNVGTFNDCQRALPPSK